jgi:hypothetical protein
MSNEKKEPRPIAEIQPEYAAACTRLGDLVYKLAAFEKDKATLIRSLEDLNFEAAASIQAEADKKKAAETAAPAVTNA